MELFEAIENRRSIRAYTDDVVSEDKLIKVLDAARLAPSWKNFQCWSYIVVSDKELRMKIGEAVGFNPDRTSYEKATYVLVVCADPNLSGNEEGKEYYMADVGISFEHAVLAAEALGLATCWVGLFPEQEVKKILDVPENLRVVALTPLGVPAKTAKPRPRKSLDQIAYMDKWGNPLVK